MAISAEFTADFSQYVAATSDATTALGRLQEAADAATLEKIEGQARVAASAVLDFANQAADAASAYIAAYAEEEAATAALSQALTAQGLASESVVQAYVDMASQFQKTTLFADDAVIKAQQVFTQIGRVGPEQMQLALNAAADLATGLGKTLPEAAEMLSRGIGSSGAAIGTLKRHLGDTIEKGASFEQIMAAVNAQFGGQAAAAMETTNGKLVVLSNQLDDVKGKIGEVLAKGLTPLLDAFLSLPDSVQTVIVTVGTVGTALAPLAIAFGSVVSAVTGLIGLLGGAAGLTAAFSALLPFLGPAGLIAVAVLALVAVWKNWDQIVVIVERVYTAIKTFLVDRFDAIVGGIKGKIDAVVGFFQGMYDKVVGHSIVPDMVADIASTMGGLDAALVQPITAATQQAAGAFQGLRDHAAGTFAGVGAAARQAGDQITGTMVLAVDSLGELNRALSEFYDKFTNNVGSMFGASDVGVMGGPGLLRDAIPRNPTTGLRMYNTITVNGGGREGARELVDELGRLMRQTRQWPGA
jgi:hypothetical protein